MHDILTLGLLVLLQAVLGFDNLLYISLESKRAPEADRPRVRKTGILIAIFLRIALLFALTRMVASFQDPLWSWEGGRVVAGAFNLHCLIVLGGGVFIMYTATKEIWHMMQVEASHELEKPPASPGKIIAWIVVMNLVFSFDSILSAMALTKVFWVMAAAIVISGVMMMVLSDKVSAFLQRNRMYEVLGLFVLFIVGIMLLTEGGHLAHLELFGHEVHAMSKATFYFVISVLVLIDVVQSRYQRKLLAAAGRHGKH